MKKYFLLLIAVVVLSAGFAASDDGFVKAPNTLVRDDATLVEEFNADDFKEYDAGDKVFFKPKVRLGEVKKLCDGIVVKGVSDLRNGKAVLVKADKVWVRFIDHDTKTHASAGRFLKDLGSEILPQFYASDENAFNASVPEGETIESFVQKLNGYAEVDYAEYQPINYTYYTPTDPGYSSQWHWTLMNMEDAWNITTGSSSVILVVNDSGVSVYTDADAVNPANIEPTGSYVKSRELQNVAIYNNGATIIDLYNSDTDGEDDFGHGTFIANMMFGDMNDGEDGAGMAPGCMLAPYKSGSCGGTIAYGLQGIDYGRTINALAINCSYGGPSYSATVQTAVTNAWNAGTLVIVASGNDGANAMGYPAGYIRSFAVGATGSTGSWWNSSNWDEGSTEGWQGDLAGDFANAELDQLFCITPSANMYGTGMDFSNWNGSGYDCATADPSDQNWGSGNYGTSYSCPSMAALIGLMGSAGTVDPKVIIDILGSTADHTSNGNVNPTATSAISGTETYDWQYGHGLLDANAALLLCSPSPFLVFDSKTKSDATGGDNDGIVEAGETIQINVTLKNDGSSDAIATFTNGTATISLDDYWINITDDTSAYANIAGGGGTQAASDTMEIEIHASTPNLHEIEFSLYIAGKYDSGAKDYSTTRTFRMTVGGIPILIVDVDSGAAVNGYSQPTEQYVYDALGALNWQYLTKYNVPSDLSPAIVDVVFVLAGNVAYYSPARSPTGGVMILTGEECDILTDYVTDGGGLYFEGAGRSGTYGGASIWAKFGTDAAAVDWDNDGYDQVENINDVSGSAGPGANLGSNRAYESNDNNPGWGAYTNSFNTPLSPTDGSTAITSDGDQGNGVTRVVYWNIGGGEGDTIFSDILFSGINSTVPYDADRLQYMDDILNTLGQSTNPTDVTAPAVTSLSAKLNPYNEGVVAISWTAPGDDVWIGRNNNAAGGYLYYDLEYKLSSSGTWLDITGEPSPPAMPEGGESYIASGLTPGESYDFRLRTQDEANNYSGYSDVISIDVLAAPVGWGGPSYPGKAILIWIEGSGDLFGGATESAALWASRVANFGYSYVQTQTAGDIGDLTSYDMVLYMGGICNLSGNQESLFTSIESSRPQNLIDGGGFLYSEVQWAEGTFAYSDYATNYIGASYAGMWDNYGLGGALNAWTAPATGQAGSAFASGDSLSAFFSVDWEIHCSMTAGSGTMSYETNNSYNIVTEYGNSVFSTALTSYMTNAAEQEDYVDRILGHFGCSAFTDSFPPAPFTLTAFPSASAGSARLAWDAPGDDEVIGGGAGAATSYEARYSNSAAFTSGQFGSQAVATGTPPTPSAAGAAETMVATGLVGNDFWFMIEATDDQGLTSYSNCAYVYVPSTLASPAILVVDTTYGGLAGFWGGTYPSLFNGITDSGAKGDIWADPFVKALQNLGFAYDYQIDVTEEKGYPNNIDILPTLTDYDVVFLFNASRSFYDDVTPMDVTNGFSPNDMIAINNYLHTDGKRLYLEDWWIMTYEWTYPTDQEGIFWDSMSANVEAWNVTTSGDYISTDGMVSAFNGESNTFSVCNGMRFQFDNQQDPDTIHNSMVPRNAIDTDEVLVVSETKCSSAPQLLNPGWSTTIAHWHRASVAQNYDVKTVASGSCMPGLTPYDDVYYYNSTFDNYVRAIMEFFGYGGVATVTETAPIQNPIWGYPGANPDDAFYVKSHYGSSPAIVKAANAALYGDVTLTTFTNVSANLHHSSQIAVGPNNIYYAQSDGTDIEIYKVPTDDSTPGAAYYPHGFVASPDVTTWYDPDYIDGAVFADGKARIVACHAGELVVYVAESPSNATTLDAERLTNFQTDQSDSSTLEPKCFNPKWSPDGDSIVFVYRPAGSGVQKSGVYVMSGIIAEIDDGPLVANWALDLDDSRITEVYQTGVHPAWSPSFSQNGDVVSFNVDMNDTFNNVTYAGLTGAGTTFAEVMDGVNFDVYAREWTDPESIFPSQAAAGDASQAFVKWAPEGGDKLLYSVYNPETLVTTLQVFSDVDNVYGGWSTKAGDYGDKWEDHSGTSVKIKGEISEYGYKDLSIKSVTRKIAIPEGNKYFGASRQIYTEPQDGFLPEGTELELTFRKAYVEGLDNYRLQLYYVASNGLEAIDSNILEIEENVTMAAFATIEKQGVYVVLAVPKASLFDNFDEVRIFPNPAIASVDIDRIIVDKLQDDITEVNIYNIAGEKVATMDEGVDFYDQTTISGMTLPGDYNTAVDKTGAVVSWMLTNDDGNAVASGVYFIVMTTEGGDTIYKKVALVK
ncbi:hypothetical protein KAI78_00065 [bacterium]|nr:hypothetical protein [bacterium]